MSAVFLIIMLSGCSSFSQVDQETKVQKVNYPTIESNSIHHHVEQLARQMFNTSNAIDLNKSIAVGTFLPSVGLSKASSVDMSPISHQLQESFTTLAVQAGLTLVEFKATQVIKLQGNNDVMLSRDLSELSEKINAEYYLTGTYMQQENSFVVNARIIDIKTKNVIAAATDYIPINTMWSDSKIMIQNQKIYRKEY